MSLFKVTQAGLAAKLPTVNLTADFIHLKNGSMGTAWTMQATSRGESPVDDEGWTLWSQTSVESAIEQGYIEEIK